MPPVQRTDLGVDLDGLAFDPRPMKYGLNVSPVFFDIKAETGFDGTGCIPGLGPMDTCNVFRPRNFAGNQVDSPPTQTANGGGGLEQLLLFGEFAADRTQPVIDGLELRIGINPINNQPPGNRHSNNRNNAIEPDMQNRKGRRCGGRCNKTYTNSHHGSHCNPQRELRTAHQYGVKHHRCIQGACGQAQRGDQV